MADKNNLKKGTITHLQNYIADKIRERGFEDENVHERLLLLAEEVGELIKACRKITGISCDTKQKRKTNVGEEITDVINMVFAVGIKLGLDIEKEFLKKNKIVDGRIYKRTL